MARHKIKVREALWDRISEGKRQWVADLAGPDYQTGDLVDIYKADQWGYPMKVFVERDAHGRFLNEYQEIAPLSTRITHIADDTALGVAEGHVVLSLAPID